MRGTGYQIALIFLGVVITAMFSVFLYHEIFPEYKIYQNAYEALEEFRSGYTMQPPPPFQAGIAQIVKEKEDKGPADVDRCTSCHVALQFSHFSPTKIATDLNGNLVLDGMGTPVQVPNEEYVFAKLDEKIAYLEKSDPLDAERLKSLKKAKVGSHTYDMEKVLIAHPLLGKETSPFEFHPINEYGCTVCHNGNGRGLTTEKAHGPVFDGEYETEFLGPEKEFLEKDPKTDPRFSKVFNDKPSHELLFQTTPLFVGGLIEAKCMQCHGNEKPDIEKEKKGIQTGFDHDKKALQTLLSMQKSLKEKGIDGTVKDLEAGLDDYTLPQSQRESLMLQIAFLKKKGKDSDKSIQEEISRLSTRAIPEKELLLASIGANSLAQVTSQIDRLTSHYRQGRELFLSQGCYACHRIEGFSRGGVGPELTNEGASYPWFVKESIYWPQADLKTSTMPNFKLDHDELEDLVTYLLAQKGRPPSISEVEWKNKISAWEKGEKKPWEEAVNPAKLTNVAYGMTVFATQGCASCHRLRGFESNVGFAAEKGDFAALLKEREWFSELFPEEVQGSLIVKAIEEHKSEIDSRLVDNVRQNSLLEEIESSNPGLLESFYSNFKFAMRHKSEESWQNTVNRVMMQYIQQYGLGRLIGPRPNWSGIYRSDEWLMEHFKKPTSHIPRSIMPVFPFDESKFYVLTHMLNELAQKNRKELSKIWEVKGFEPSLAFKTLCSQCHGENFQGNGPVSEWIYPIPKNLRSGDFLRNYTKANVTKALHHGVKGTPMPPWGETAQDKSFENNEPVLNGDQINKLVDWLFFKMGIPSDQSIPKWNYTPEDVLRELKNEGSELKEGTPKEGLHLPPLSYLALPSSRYFAATAPVPSTQVDSIFDVIANSEKGGDQNLYYIKRKYYTEENLREGEAFFNLNCAICHGKEADGAGNRAQVMQDAKPRMLVNLDWIDSRDDLRLLRSIKYGVAGTSMTPWGDLTTSLQRLQLVMYIRSLSFENVQKNLLSKALYEQFTSKEQLIDRARNALFEKINPLKEKLGELEKEKNQSSDPAKLLEILKLESEARSSLKKYQEDETLYLSLKENLSKQRQIEQNLAAHLLKQNVGYEEFLKAIGLDPVKYELKNGVISIEQDPKKKEQIELIQKNILAQVNLQIQQIEKEKTLLEGKIPSLERNEALFEAAARLQSLKKLSHEVIQTFAETKVLRVDQQETVKKLKTDAS